MSAPIGNTCPDINKALKVLNWIRKELPQDAFDLVKSELDTIEDYFEELRTANSVLRGWGEDMEEANNALEIKLSEAEDTIESLKQTESI